MNPIDPATPAIRRLADLAALLPADLRADWRGTNHYELTTAVGDDGYWWLDLRDIPADEIIDRTEYGQRLGLILDAVEAVSAARDDLARLAGLDPNRRRPTLAEWMRDGGAR